MVQSTSLEHPYQRSSLRCSEGRGGIIVAIFFLKLKIFKDNHQGPFKVPPGHHLPMYMHKHITARFYLKSRIFFSHCLLIVIIISFCSHHGLEMPSILTQLLDLNLAIAPTEAITQSIQPLISVSQCIYMYIRDLYKYECLCNQPGWANPTNYSKLTVPELHLLLRIGCYIVVY